MKLAIALLLAVTATPHKAVATPVFYTDRASFDAAAGPLSLESFESFSNGASVVFDDFTLTETSVADYQSKLYHLNSGSYESFASAAVTHGSQAVYYDDNGNSVGTFAFTSPITAFGLDVTTTQDSSITVGGGDFTTTFDRSANTAGFWGVIKPTGISQLSFSASGDPKVAFDQLSYGEAVS